MLTERTIREAKPAAKTRIIWDSRLKGFGVRVTPAGSKAYILDYRVNGRKRRATLARVSEIGLKDARARAGNALAGIRDGDDPLARRQEARQAPTVNDGLARFFDEFVPARMAAGRMAASTVEGYRLQAENYIAPAFGKRRVADVTRRDVERAVAALPPVHRNRVLALVSRLFTLFEHWEWRPQHTNPARGIERAREEPRDRVLAPSELEALGTALAACEARKPACVAAIRVAALTGLRIGEVLAFRWEHVDFEAGTVLLPRTKTGRRTQALSAPALAVLSALPRINEWVFTTGRAGLSYKTVQKVFAECAIAAGLAGADGKADVRLHDLRRTVMTSAAASGLGAHVLRDLLGHKTTAMADRYIRRTGSALRDATERSGASMAALLNGEGGAVVPMARRHGA